MDFLLLNRFSGFLLIAIIGFLSLLWAPATMYAQDTPDSLAETTSSDSTNLVLRRVKFEGNDQVNTATLEMLIRTHTNREFLGITGFTPWYFIWKLTKSFGEKPALLNYQTVATDLERITRYYNSIGFLKATADTNIVTKAHKAEVTFKIDEGERSYIKTVAYSGLPDSAFKSQRDKINFYKNSDLTEDQINDTTYKANSPYLESELDLERGRIITHLKNNGYAAVERDSISALIKRHTDNKQLLDVLYLIKPGKRYTFGDLSIQLAGPGTDTLYNYQQKDTLSDKPYTLNHKKIYLEKEKSAQTHFRLLTDQLLFKPGDIFDYNRYIHTVNGFQNLGMMSLRQFGFSENGNAPDYSADTIPVYFSLQTLPKNSIKLNLYGLKRYGYGSGAGVTYTNNNLFGKAENLELGVTGSFEYVNHKKLQNLAGLFDDSVSIQTKSKFFQSFETHADFSLPRLTFPFAWLDKYLFFSDSRTHYSLAYSQSDQLLFDINAKLTFKQRYEITHTKRFTSFLDLFELELLDTNPSAPFEAALQNEFKNDPLALEQILEDFRPQFSSVIRYTFQSERTDLIKRNYGYYSEYTIAMGGNIPYLIDRYLVTPDTVEGNLPSPVKFSAHTLDYSRFVKATADYRRYFPLSSHTVFAARGFGGYAFPFGKNKTIPLDERFYAGGSNDIRGWAPFSLGPGAIPFNQVTINGGEIKLLAQSELRQTVLKHFLSSNWIFAVFADAGNVWYGPNINLPDLKSNSTIGNQNTSQINFDKGKFKSTDFYKQIAVGSGVGLRLDFDYLIARFDFAFRIHDLQQGWLNNNHLYFHFGIGQSF